MSSPIRKQIDEPTFLELIRVLRKAGIDFVADPATPIIIEPITTVFPRRYTLTQIISFEGEGDEEMYVKQEVKPASYDELDKLQGALSKQQADDLREELKRAREEDWD